VFRLALFNFIGHNEEYFLCYNPTRWKDVSIYFV
jgi:hypothetical protein